MTGQWGAVYNIYFFTMVADEHLQYTFKSMHIQENGILKPVQYNDQYAWKGKKLISVLLKENT